MTGRKKNLIILDSGENVSPEELEKLLGKCDAIKELSLIHILWVCRSRGPVCAPPRRKKP